MTQTILPKKALGETPIATDDEHHQQLAADPAIHQFPQGSVYGGRNAFNSSGGPNYGTPNSFGSAGGYGSPIQATAPAAPAPNLTQAGTNAAQGADVLVQHDKESTDWINKKWRPAMGWMYMLTCTVD